MGDNGPKVIHVGYQPANVEQVYFPQAEVVGDLGASLRLLADRVEGKIPNATALLPLAATVSVLIVAAALLATSPKLKDWVTPPLVTESVGVV